ncbi:proton-coupled amino acid transporter-like protein pathetic isoform X1 [Anopheles albimanus]|uniref:proton-coupled amino acid transporter-like protein pathetic isoform X1 n=1 Tax=Anopheles albimanus TaxID=7167 RepID=UPI0016402281|nr:proton-coupled amino acid transporter-like protein pathetic isoform X1 [Anopheles albimanus]
MEKQYDLERPPEGVELLTVKPSDDDGSREGAGRCYDPHLHRNLANPTSTVGTFVHVMKSALGIGILSVPGAFKDGGLVFGVAGTFFLAMLCSHSAHILVSTSYRICKKERIPVLGFGETVEKACSYGPPSIRTLGKILRNSIDWYLMLTTVVVFIVFVGTTLREVINYRTGWDWGDRTYILLVGVPILFITQIRELKYLVPFSAIAGFLILANIVISLVFVFQEPLSLEGRRLFPTTTTVAPYMGVVYFALDATCLIFPLENQMRNPRHYLGCPGIVNLNYVCLAVLYSFFGAVGYIRYGESVKSSIILNFPPDSVLVSSIQVLSAVAVLFSIGLIFYVPTEIAWKKLQPRVPKEWTGWAQSGLRLGMLLLNMVAACGIPHLGTFMGLLGSVLNPILALWIPIVVDTVYRWPNRRFGRFRWRLVKNGACAAFGLFLLITGTISSVQNIVALYQ